MPLLLAAFALSASSPARAEYPPIVKKELYATKDFRGKKAPKYVWGKTVSGSIPSLKGKVIVVDFWATWCPPCRETLPELDALAKEFSKELVVIGISDEPKATLTSFLKKTPVGYVITSDPAKTMSKVLGVKGIPHVLVISPDGVVRWQGFPLDETDRLTKEKVVAIIEASKKKSIPAQRI